MYFSLDPDATSMLHYFPNCVTGVNGEGGGAQKGEGEKGRNTWLLRLADFTREFTMFTSIQGIFAAASVQRNEQNGVFIADVLSLSPLLLSPTPATQNRFSRTHLTPGP